MQAAKDSFYMALRDRLASLNPGRVITLNGEIRPAIVVRENTEPHFAAEEDGAFYVDWGSIRAANPLTPMMGIDCKISYSSTGSSDAGVDRGRLLAKMDEELMRIGDPPFTKLRDYSQSPSVDLHSGVLWTRPEFSSSDEAAAQRERSASSARMGRLAKLRVFFYLPEVQA